MVQRAVDSLHLAFPEGGLMVTREGASAQQERIRHATERKTAQLPRWGGDGRPLGLLADKVVGEDQGTGEGQG